jgi:16S rRNA (cytidine1402-2'-O)-methyltransferase
MESLAVHDPTPTLWLVATPIGNRGDWPPRAIEVLKSVAAIACEDTRHSRPLLASAGIERPLLPYHEHNEREATPKLVARLAAGESIALIADAGTPLVSDPGWRLVHATRAAGFRVSAVPGPCAAIVALTISGLPTDRFAFEGFLPAKAALRRSRLEALASESRTLVFYESRHRILECLDDLAAVFGADRRAAVARELTKLHESVYVGTLAELKARIAARDDDQLGEFVVVLEGLPADAAADAARLAEGRRLYRALAKELKSSAAARIAAEISGAPRRALYRDADDERGADR